MAGERQYMPASEFCISVRDGTHDSPKAVEKGRKLVTSRHLTSGRLDLSDAYLISEEDFDEINRRSKVDRWDVLISMIGTVGEPCLIREQPDFAIKNIGLFKTKSEIDGKWLYYYLRSKDAQQWIREQSRGTTQQYIPLGALRNFPVLITDDLVEQEEIVSILGALDDKIELNRRMNATLEAMARALFQSWFVDFDPVRAKLDGRKPIGMDDVTAAVFPATFEDSPLGQVPKGWKAVELKEFTSKIGSGATPRGGSSVYVEDGVALIRSQNVHDHEFRWDGLARLSEHSANELKNVEVQDGDVLFNITGDSILRTCVVDPEVLPARVNQHVAILRSSDSTHSRYLHLYMVQPRIKEFLIGLNAGATRPAVTKGHLQSVLILKPEPEVLAAFARTSGPLFQQTEVNRTQSRTLSTLRDTLLPKLLSGEIRVRLMESKIN